MKLAIIDYKESPIIASSIAENMTRIKIEQTIFMKIIGWEILRKILKKIIGKYMI